MRSLRASLALCFLLAGAFCVRPAEALQWARFAIVSPTTTMSAGHLCYTDGLGIACDSAAPLASGLGVSDRITSGTSSVFVAQDSAVSVTIGGSNVANFGTGGLGITAINASGLIQSSGISNTGAISTTGTGYFGGNVGIRTTSPLGVIDVRGDARFGGATANKGLRITETGGVTYLQAGDGAGGTEALSISPWYSPTPYLYITSGSLVGMGTTNPQGVLHAQTQTSTTPVIIADASASTAGTNHYQLRTSGLNRFALGLQGTETGSNAGSDFNIYRYSDGATWLSNALTIKRSTGYVGINNTVAPQTALEVSGTISATHFVGDGSLLTGLSAAAASDRITSGTTSVVAANGGPVSFTIAGSNVANFGTGGLGITNINASGAISATGTGYFGGKVGIGTTDPSQSLTVSGIQQINRNNNGNVLLFTHSGTTNGAVSVNGGAGGSLGLYGTQGLNIYTSSTVRMSIASSGLVGIGTTAPTTSLEVVGTASATNVAAASVTTAGIKLTSATTASAQCTSDADIGAIRLNGTRAEICSPYPN